MLIIELYYKRFLKLATIQYKNFHNTRDALTKLNAIKENVSSTDPKEMLRQIVEYIVSIGGAFYHPRDYQLYEKVFGDIRIKPYWGPPPLMALTYNSMLMVEIDNVKLADTSMSYIFDRDIADVSEIFDTYYEPSSLFNSAEEIEDLQEIDIGEMNTDTLQYVLSLSDDTVFTFRESYCAFFK